MPRLAFVETSLSGSGFVAMRYARELGAKALFLTRDASYYPAHGAADPHSVPAISELIECETNDVRQVVAELVSRGVTAVLSAGEHHVEQAARAAHELGVIGLSPAAAGAARNKATCYAACEAAGVPVPRYETAKSVPDAVCCADRIGYPCVVKPVDGTASLAVTLCSSAEQVAQHAAAVLARRRNARGQRCACEVMIVEFLAGSEVSVETLSAGGSTLAFGVTAKHLGQLPYFVEVGHTFPAPLAGEEADRCVRTAILALTAIRFDTGVAHTEFKLTPDGPRLLEVNARPAGDHITDLVRLATGVDPLRAWMAVALGAPPPMLAPPSGAAAIRYLTPWPGRVLNVGGQALARGVPGVTELCIGVRPGDIIGVPRSSHDRSGYVIAYGDGPAAAEGAAEVAAGQILVQVEEM